MAATSFEAVPHTAHDDPQPSHGAPDPRVVDALRDAIVNIERSGRKLKWFGIVTLTEAEFARAVDASAAARPSADDDDFVEAVRAARQSTAAYSMAHRDEADRAFWRALLATHARLFHDVHAMTVAMVAASMRRTTRRVKEVAFMALSFHEMALNTAAMVFNHARVAFLDA